LQAPDQFLQGQIRLFLQPLANLFPAAIVQQLVPAALASLRHQRAAATPVLA
jgi:hypothetical protein